MLRSILKNRSLWEHPIIDLWTIPHILSGVLVAYAIIFLGLEIWAGLGVSIVLAVFWELFEKVVHLSDVEYRTNGLSDIIVAQAGYGAGAWIFVLYGGTGIDTVIAIVAVLIFVVVCVVGWLSHHWYGKKI